MASPAEQLSWLELDQLKPGRYQCRRHFDAEALEELAASIRANGVNQPPVVRKDPQDNKYELLAGERRWRACQLARIDKIPVIVRSRISEDDALALGVVENIQRESFNCIEEARAFQLMCGRGYTHTKVAEKVGKSRTYVSNALRLLSLDVYVQQLLIEGSIDRGHAKVLLAAPSAVRTRLARETAAKSLSVRTLERRVKEAGRHWSKPSAAASPDIARLERALGEFFGAEVKIEYSPAAGAGRISVAFHNLDAFDGIMQKWGFKPE